MADEPLLADGSKLLGTPKRLGILAIVRGASSVSFRLIADTLDISDQELSQELRYLKLGGLIKSRKVGRKAWISITAEGDEAYLDQARLLRRILQVGDSITIDEEVR